jgi:hypothetical protein
LNKAVATLGPRGSVMPQPLKRPQTVSSVFDFAEGRQLLSTARHWTNETPRFENPALVKEDNHPNTVQQRYATGMSKRNIRSWDHVMQGYLGLFYYILFFFVYTNILVQQYKPATMYLVNSHIRGALLSEDSNLPSVKDHGKFWEYFIGEDESEDETDLKFIPTGEFDA